MATRAAPRSQVYEPFFADFGPLNLGQLYRFVEKLRSLLAKAEERRCGVYYVCGADPHRRSNSAVLLGAYCILEWGWSAEEAYKPVSVMKPFVPYRDASCGASTFNLTPLDCLRAVARAREVGLIDWPTMPGEPASQFDIEEYEYYEKVENGDLNWIVPGKFVAFSGPSARHTEFYGYRTLVPEDYVDYWHRRNVQHVVRLNKKMYEKRRFTDNGIAHHDLYFPDGTCPTEAILRRFLELADAEEGAFAVHCKAGLGRTGVLICSWMMKEWRFTANEAIAYIRICRPGSVIGPQQHFLREMEQRLWAFGDAQRAAKAERAREAAVRNGAVAPASPERGHGVPSPVKCDSPVAAATTHVEGQYHSSPLKNLRTGTRAPAGSRRDEPVSRTLHTDTVQSMYGRPRVARDRREPLSRTIHSTDALRDSHDAPGVVPGTPDKDSRNGKSHATRYLLGGSGSSRGRSNSAIRSRPGGSVVSAYSVSTASGRAAANRRTASSGASPLRSVVVTDNNGNYRLAEVGPRASGGTAVQRIVTSSGQPRKVPAAALRAGGAYANAHTPAQAATAATSHLARTNLLGGSRGTSSPTRSPFAVRSSHRR